MDSVCIHLGNCTCGCGEWCKKKGMFDDNGHYIPYDCTDCPDKELEGDV